MLTPVAVLVLLSLALGIWGGPAIELSMKVAQQALDREAYIEAVSPSSPISTPGADQPLVSLQAYFSDHPKAISGMTARPLLESR